MTTEQLNELLIRRPMWVALAKKRVPLDAVEDVVQDALIRAIEWEGEVRNPAAWFHTLVVNQCNDHLRRNTTKPRKGERVQRMYQLDDTAEVFMIHSSEPQADEQLELIEEEELDGRRRMWFYLAVGKLRSPEIRAVILRYAQTGEVNQASSTDRIRIRRAIFLLRSSAEKAGLARASAPGQPPRYATLR